MATFVELQAEPGAIGWHVVEPDEPHRCSRKNCLEPAVIYYLGRTYGWKHRAHLRRRWICLAHMNQYQDVSPWWVDGDRICREKYQHELDHPDGA